MKPIRLAALSMCGFFLCGCSAYLAAVGSPEPNLTILEKGASRSEIELHFGQPVKTLTQDNNKTIGVYEYQSGNEPDARRVVAYVLLDILTLFIWELIGTPLEAFHGETFEVAVTYDDDNTATDIKSTPKK